RPLAGRFALHLVGGDRIGGEPVGVRGEQLIWKSIDVGEIEIPMRLLAGLTRPDGNLRDDRGKDDIITLTNGDTVHGTIANFSPNAVALQTDAGLTEIPLDSLVSLAL